MIDSVPKRAQTDALRAPRLPVLPRYVLREFISAFAVSFAAAGSLVAFLALRNAWRHARFFGLTLGDVLGFSGALAPAVLPMVLGLATLAASAMTFARLAADGEVDAARAAGAAPARLAVPVLAASALLAAAALSINQWGLAWAGRSFAAQADRLQMEALPRTLAPGAARALETSSGRAVRLVCLAPRGRDGSQRPILLSVLEPDAMHAAQRAPLEAQVRRLDRMVFAPHFTWDPPRLSDEGTIAFTLRFYEPVFFRPGADGEGDTWFYGLGEGGDAGEGSGDLKETAVLEQHIPRLLNQGFKLGNARMLYSISEHFEEAARAEEAAAAHPDDRALAVEAARRKLEAHQKVALAMTPLVFALVGVPLGLACRSGRRALALGGALAVALLIYYPIAMLAGSLARTDTLPPALLAWAPNVLVGLPGAMVFYRRAVRG